MYRGMGNGPKDGGCDSGGCGIGGSGGSGGSGDWLTSDGTDTIGGESCKPKLADGDCRFSPAEDGGFWNGRTDADYWNWFPVCICWARDADIPVTASKEGSKYIGGTLFARGRHIPGAVAPPEGGDNRPCC